MAQVYIPEKKSAIDKIMQGLQVAQSVYGVKSAYDQNKLNEMKMKEVEQAKDLSEGKFTANQASQQYQVASDSPYFKDAAKGTIKETGEEFFYLPEEKLKKIKTVSDITEMTEKSQRKREESQGRISERDLFGATNIIKEESGMRPPAGWEKSGWQEKWDIVGGKQQKRWVLSSPAAQYFAQQERADTAADQKSLDVKIDFAKVVSPMSPVLTALKTADSKIKSDDPKAPIAGADALLSALKSKEVVGFFGNGEIWDNPALAQAVIAKAGPEAQALWTDLVGIIQKVNNAEAGLAVSKQEAAIIRDKLGAHAFSNPTTLKQGIANAKREFFNALRSKEAPLVGRKELDDYRKAPGAISSEDPFFDIFTKKKETKKSGLPNIMK